MNFMTKFKGRKTVCLAITVEPYIVPILIKLVIVTFVKRILFGRGISVC